MAFQVRCPSCNKLYAADDRMVGKKIRCRGCNNVFAVAAPEKEAATVPAAAAGASSAVMRAHRLEDSVQHVEASDLTGTHRAMETPPDSQPQEELFGAPEKPVLKPSLPQQFPGSLVIEAWLPLGLSLIAAVWCVSTTFSNNNSGQAWMALVRVATVAILFLLLIAPVTYKVVKNQFKQMLRLLPPNPRFRVASTFALPATLGYFFWLNIGSVGGLATGLILGLVLVAAVFWLLMRLDPQEAATVYAWAAGTFLITTAISGGILAGASALLNQAMISAHAISVKQSPLGEPLTWTPPTPPPVKAPSVARGSGQDQDVPSAPTTHPSVAVAHEESAAVVPTTQGSVDATPTVEGSNSASPKKSPDTGLFVNPDEDSFVAGIRQSNLSWVNHVRRPDAQSAFDFTLNPLAPSSFIGLVTTEGQMQLKLGEMTPSSYGETPKPIALPEEIKDPELFASKYALSGDGKVLLHLLAYQVQVIHTGDTEKTFVSLRPPPSRTTPLKPMLLGVIREREFVVRWSADNCEQYIQRYSYDQGGTWITTAPIKDPPAPLDACAVSANLTEQIFFAALSERGGKAPQIRVYNLTSASMEPRPGALPSSVRSLVDFEHAEIAFSPDGKLVALLLEKGDEGRVTEWSIGPQSLTENFSTTCKVPTQIELTGKRGRGLVWLNGQYLMVHGQTLISVRSGDVLGTLTSDAVTGEQAAPNNELFLTYTGADSHSHLAVIDINPAALRKTPVH